jgi:hypothetical protein
MKEGMEGHIPCMGKMENTHKILGWEGVALDLSG